MSSRPNREPEKVARPRRVTPPTEKTDHGGEQGNDGQPGGNGRIADEQEGEKELPQDQGCKYEGESGLEPGYPRNGKKQARKQENKIELEIKPVGSSSDGINRFTIGGGILDEDFLTFLVKFVQLHLAGEQIDHIRFLPFMRAGK